MGYKGIYIVRDAQGKSLGKFGGWTGADAIKLAFKYKPELAKLTGLTAKPTGEDTSNPRQRAR